MAERLVLVTRAEPGASETCARLAARGLKPVNAATAQIAFRAQMIDLDGVAALAVTSRNGVAALAQMTETRALPVFAVGDATAQAARAAGFADVRSAAGDVTALVELIVAAAPAGAVLHGRGADQAGDLVGALTARGLSARAQILYAAEPVTGLPVSAWQALQAGARVLIHSPKGASRLVDLARAAGMEGVLAAAPVVAISAAAAAPLRALGATDITLAARPDGVALLDALV